MAQWYNLNYQHLPYLCLFFRAIELLNLQTLFGVNREEWYDLKNSEANFRSVV